MSNNRKNITKAKALEILRKQLISIDEDDGKFNIPQGFEKWRRSTNIAIAHIFGENSRHVKEFNDIRYTPIIWYLDAPDPDIEVWFQEGLAAAIAFLHSLIEEIEEYWDDTEASSLVIARSQEEESTQELVGMLRSYEKMLRAYETRLHDQLLSTFDLSELKALCFDLNIDYEILSGENKSDKARELILYCRRHNRTAEFLERCRELRPHLLW